MWLTSIEEFSKKLHDEKDPAHDLTHSQRMISLCRLIAPAKADLNLILEAAYFHGLIYAESKIREFLTSIGFDKPHIETIIKTVSNASSKATPQTLEEQVLHDANILDALGAIGIARAFTKGGYEYQTLKETLEIMKRNMNRILYTPKAKKIGIKRKRFMKQFLKHLKDEDKNVLAEIKRKIHATLKILNALGYSTENVSTQEVHDYLTGESFSEDVTTLLDILDSENFMIHEIVEISELKKMGLKIHKRVIVESPKEMIYQAHFVAQEFEMEYALKKKDYAWVKRRLRDHQMVLHDDPNLPDKMKPIAQRIYDKFIQFLL